MRIKKSIPPSSFEEKPRKLPPNLFGQPFTSKYPLEAGMIIKISSPVQDPGKRPGKYTQYIWVQKLLHRYRRGYKRQPQYRPVRVTYCFIPRTDCVNAKVRVQTKIVQAKRVRDLMREKGYEVFAENIHWYGDKGSIRRFYVTIGLLKRKKPGPQRQF